MKDFTRNSVHFNNRHSLPGIAHKKEYLKRKAWYSRLSLEFSQDVFSPETFLQVEEKETYLPNIFRN